MTEREPGTGPRPIADVIRDLLERIDAGAEAQAGPGRPVCSSSSSAGAYLRGSAARTGPSPKRTRRPTSATSSSRRSTPKLTPSRRPSRRPSCDD